MKKPTIFYALGGISLLAFLLAAFLAYAYFYDIPRSQVIAGLPRPIRNTIDAVRNIPYLKYSFRSHSLSIYKLYIQDNDYQKLKDALPNTADQILDEDDIIKVPAKLVYDGVERNVKVSPRGDTYPNWLFEKKAWNIEFTDGKLFNGYPEIKLVLPEFKDGFINPYRAKKLGLPTPAGEGEFVILKINDGPEMVYLQKEGWTKEFLKRHFGTDNGNLYGEIGVLDPIFTSTAFWKKYVSVVGEENNYADLEYLLYLINDAPNDEFVNKIFTVIDADNFYSWHIHSLLAGSTHQDARHNIRLFFNREKGKFFFIPWDVFLYDWAATLGRPREAKIYGMDFNNNPLIARILANPEFLLERNKRLWAYVGNDDNLADDLAHFDTIADRVDSAIFSDSVKFNSNARTEAKIDADRSTIGSNYAFLREQLDNAEASVGISLRPASIAAIAINFTYKGASPINFNGFKISLRNLNPAHTFQLYEDANNNNIFDAADKKNSVLEYKNNVLSAQGLNLMLYSNRTGNGPGNPIILQVTRKRFFVVAQIPYAVDSADASFTMFNEVTGSKLDPTIHVNNLNSLEL